MVKKTVFEKKKKEKRETQKARKDRKFIKNAGKIENENNKSQTHTKGDNEMSSNFTFL